MSVTVGVAYNYCRERQLGTASVSLLYLPTSGELHRGNASANCISTATTFLPHPAAATWEQVPAGWELHSFQEREGELGEVIAA